MQKLALMTLFVLTVACSSPAPHPPALSRQTQPLRGGTMLVLSVREPVQPAEVQALIDAERHTEDLVRVFTYTVSQTPGQDAPARRFEWDQVSGLRTF